MRDYRSVFLVASLITSLMLSACITHSDARRVYRYTCSDGYEFTADFSRDEESVLFIDADREIKLRQIQAASGTRYTDGEEFVLVTKGLMAFIRLEGEVIHADCVGDNL